MSRIAAVLLLAATAHAGVPLQERPDANAVFAVRADVTIEGTVRTHAGQGQEQSMPLKAQAVFQFDEKHLDEAAVDPAARRMLRVYSAASASTSVGDFQTTTALPSALRRVVIAGRAEGPVKFSLDGLMTREAVDLLDMPGDPLSLAAAMPAEADASFAVPEHAAQMLCGMDVLTKSTLAGRVQQSAGGTQVTLSGNVEGARLGAPVKTGVSGTVSVDPAGRIMAANLTYDEKAEIGTITPGLDSRTTVRLTRRPVDKTLDATGVPTAVPPTALKLYLDAPSWGIRVLHERDWHVFYANTEGNPAVVILRLLDDGKLLSQVNLAKLKPAAAGQSATPEQFEADIRRSLGTRFGAIVERSQETREDDVKLTRVVASGEFHYEETVSGETLRKSRPMEWTYYLIAHPDGRQLSAVFAHEPSERTALTGRDLELISALEFFPPQVASKP